MTIVLKIYEHIYEYMYEYMKNSIKRNICYEEYIHIKKFKKIGQKSAGSNINIFIFQKEVFKQKKNNPATWANGQVLKVYNK